MPDNPIPISRPDLRWFCHLAVERNILTPEEIHILLEVLGENAHLLEYTEELFARNYHHDRLLIQNLVTEAGELARAGVPAPTLSSLNAESGLPDAGERAGLPPLPPERFPDPEAAREWLLQALQAARKHRASDVHLSAGAPPCWRRAGRLESLARSPCPPAAARQLNLALLSETEQTFFLEAGDLCAAVETPDGNRYRISLVSHAAGSGGTYHIIPREVPELAALGFPNPDTIEELLHAHNGLILITGPAGSGKTTTMAALIAILNRTRYCHVITVEDPIEIVHPEGTCFITQRQVALHTRDYPTALRAALREDPDVIVVGEMRDLDTIETAVGAAETGHLVIGTLHTGDAASTLSRVLAVFPPVQQSHIRAMLAESLRGIICQRFLPSADGDGQVLASELLIGTPAVANLIREGRAHQLEGVMQTGISQGMQPMDQDLLRLFREGRIDEATAARNIRSKENMARLRALAKEMKTKHTPVSSPGKTRIYLDENEL